MSDRTRGTVYQSVTADRAQTRRLISGAGTGALAVVLLAAAAVVLHPPILAWLGF